RPRPANAGRVRRSRCTVPAGSSPVSVDAGVPSSRPQAGGEILPAQAGRQEPLRREQDRGPQHQVNPAASTDSQRRSRAAHVTAKARSGGQETGAESPSGPPGVRGVARDRGTLRNWRGPSELPSSRRGVSYKPKAKSSAAQRESEGAVGLMMAVQHNAAGGKGPCGGHVGGGGKREGMAGNRPNNPGGCNKPVDKVRQLQRRLWTAAKRSPDRRFHALYDRIFRRDVLEEGRKRVRRNEGAAGVREPTRAELERYGVERFVGEIEAELKTGSYRPKAGLRRYIPKADGKQRPLGIPTV